MTRTTSIRAAGVRVPSVVLVTALGLGCPVSAPVSEGPTTPEPLVVPLLQLEPLPMPEPFTGVAWTRTGPVTLVGDLGDQAAILDGHHIRLQVLEVNTVRARVRCVGCREPVEGWVQREYLLPEGYAAPEADWKQPRLSLALHVAEQRRHALAGEPIDLGPLISPDRYVGLLDQGFHVTERGAYCPPWAEEEGFVNDSLIAVLNDGAWKIVLLAHLEAPQSLGRLLDESGVVAGTGLGPVEGQ